MSTRYFQLTEYIWEEGEVWNFYCGYDSGRDDIIDTLRRFDAALFEHQHNWKIQHIDMTKHEVDVLLKYGNSHCFRPEHNMGKYCEKEDLEMLLACPSIEEDLGDWCKGTYSFKCIHR